VDEVRAIEKVIKKKTMLSMVGKPEYIADIALFLASEKSRFITGQVIVADGGRMDNLTHSI
jgi:3-oxoacyl-[acyl-carrier protein] reductase